MQLTNFQLDALREIGNIGNGHVSTCLSQLANEKIIPIIPEIKLVPANKFNELIEDSEGLTIGISSGLLGEVMGKVVMIFPYENGLSMLNETIKERDPSLTTISESDESYLKKIGQLIISTYTHALSNFLDILLVSYTANIVIYKGEDFLNWLTQELEISLKQQTPLPYSEIDSVLCYQSTFNKSPFLRFWGSFFLLFDGQTMKVIVKAIDKLILKIK
ncbi:MAG: chemotaxis protein CheC [bacterium]